MPAVLKLLRDQYGVTQKEFTKMVKEGKISGDDLIDAFIKIGESSKFLKGASAGAETLNAVWQNFKESLQTQLGQFFLDNSKQIKAAVDKLGPTLSQLIKDAGPLFIDLIDGFTKLVGWLKQGVDWYNKLSPGQKDFVLKLIQIAAVLGPVVVALGSLMGAFAGIAAGIAAVLTPAGAVIAAIVGIGAAIGAIIVWVKKFGGENSAIFQTLKDAWNSFYQAAVVPVWQGIQQFWASVIKAFDQVKGAIGGNTQAWGSWWTGIKAVLGFVWKYIQALFSGIVTFFKGLLGVLGNVVEGIGSFISGIIKIFKGLTDFIVGVFTGDWKRAWTGIKEIWDGIWDAIYGTLANFAKAVGNMALTIYNSVVNFFKKLYNELVGHSIVPDMVNAIISWFKRLVDGVKNVINIIKGIFNGFASAIKNFANLFANGVKEIVGFFGSLPGKIKGALGNLASSLYNFGQNVIQGFVNGMASIGERAIAKARDIANSVKDIVKGALGIGSPSKVFREYGRNVVQGFVLGISGEQDQLTKTLSGFSEKPRFEQVNGSPNAPITGGAGASGAAISIENYYANDEVDPWRQAEDWYFLITSRGGVA
jgi:phage-related protein